MNGKFVLPCVDNVVDAALEDLTFLLGSLSEISCDDIFEFGLFVALRQSGEIRAINVRFDLFLAIRNLLVMLHYKNCDGFCLPLDIEHTTLCAHATIKATAAIIHVSNV